jgi:hypothetical protein
MSLLIDIESVAAVATLIWFVAEILFRKPKSKRDFRFVFASCIAFLLSMVSLGLTVMITAFI